MQSFISALLVVTLLPFCLGSHRYGGFFTWKPTGVIVNDIVEIEVLVRHTWRGICLYNNPNTVGLCDSTGNNCQTNTLPVIFNETCTERTDPSAANAWSIMQSYFLTNVSTTDFSGQFYLQQIFVCCWVSGITGTTLGEELYSLIDLSIRSDTGRPNTAPDAVYVPFRTFYSGCAAEVPVVAIDTDNDRISCRIANASTVECGFHPCNLNGYFSMQNCRLTYNGNGSPSNLRYAVWVIIEDHPRTTINVGNRVVTPNETLSNVPYQIIVDVIPSTTSCTLPEFGGNTPEDGATFGLTPTDIFNVTLESAPTTSSFNVIGPDGTVVSSIFRLPTHSYVIVTWTPVGFTSDFLTYVCFTAEDNGVLSNQRCLTILVTVAAPINPCETNNGGCSDLCVWGGTSMVHTCACSRSCWSVAQDGVTCIPNIQVVCPNSNMNITVPDCAVDVLFGLTQYSIGNTSLPVPSGCAFTSDGNNNSIAAFPVGTCGTIVQDEVLNIRLINYVHIYLAGNEADNSAITRVGNFYNLELSCFYPKYANITNQFSVAAETQVVNELSVPGLGAFEFNFDYFSAIDFTFARSLYDYPLSYELNSDVFFGIRASSSIQNVVLFTKSCFAFPVGGDVSTRYDLIVEGCAVDTTIQQYTSPFDLQNRFSIKAFRFRFGLPGITANTQIALQCTVQICVQGNNTRCAQGCIPAAARRRRQISSSDPTVVQNNIDAEEEEERESFVPTVQESPNHEITGVGPIIILIPNDGNGEEGPEVEQKENSDLLSKVLIAGGVIGGLIVVLLAIYIMMKFRRSGGKNVENIAL